MTNPKIDSFLERAERWRPEMEMLRQITLDCGLTEELKWGRPCYTYDGGNVALIGAFKEYCALSFMKGSLLKDPRGALRSPGPNSRAARLVRFTSASEIAALEPAVKELIREAVAVEQAGIKVDFKRDADPEPPPELQDALDENPELRAAWEALTPGRRRGYVIHFSGAKQSSTRSARIERHLPRILAGKGMHDR